MKIYTFKMLNMMIYVVLGTEMDICLDNLCLRCFILKCSSPKLCYILFYIQELQMMSLVTWLWVILHCRFPLKAIDC